MIIYVFGNPDLPEDSLPLRLLPKLHQKFPHIDFQEKDPNEEWEASGELIILDTVQGIPAPKIFEGLEIFAAAPRVSLHDFDALANLRLLLKLGKVERVRVIGIPPDSREEEALQFVSEVCGTLTA
jgi:hypothetical protein